MNRKRRLAAILLTPSVTLALGGGTGRTADTPRRCCFTNERFAGVCEVAPEQDTTCADILAYLNNPNSSGKTYCGTTAVREGWSLVECSEGTPTPTAETSGGKTTAVANRR